MTIALDDAKRKSKCIVSCSALCIARCNVYAETMNTATAGAEARMVVPTDLIDVQTVADLLAVDRSTVTRRAKAGTLPVLVQLASGIYIFDINDIRPLLEPAK